MADETGIVTTAPSVPELKKSEIIGSKEWADSIRQETKALAEFIDTEYLHLAKNLWLIFDTPQYGDKKNNAWYSKWGYGYIGDYESKELGIHPRKAERLRRIWAVLGVELAPYMTPEQRGKVLKLGYSKMRELSRKGFLTPANFTHWLDHAEKTSYVNLVEDIQAHLMGRDGVKKGALGKVEPLDQTGEVIEPDIDETMCDTALNTNHVGVGDGVTAKQMFDNAAKGAINGSSGKEVIEEKKEVFRRVFNFYKDQWDTVEAALERAKQLSGSKFDNFNMSLICLDFLATNDFKQAGLEQVQRFLTRIEKALNIKLIAVSPDNYEILYGYKLLNKMVMGNPTDASKTDDKQPSA